MADIKNDIPADCSANIYVETDANAVDGLDRSHAATDAWYHNGIEWYDYATG